MKVVGVNIGALTVKVVALRDNDKSAKVAAHQGRPLEVLETLLGEAEFADVESFAVSGHLGHVSEAAATQRALGELKTDFDAVVSLGGECFLVYLVTGGRITSVLSHNKCAAGSGEFFVQQIGRMGLAIDEAIRRSFDGKIIPLAARCSVHCKSDVTHKLNRKEATAEDILHTLNDSMANKVVSLLEKSQRQLRRVLVIGGVARNGAMLAALREKLPATDFVVLTESPWFEAWGAALVARDNPCYKSPKTSLQPSLGSLPPLSGYSQQVQVIAAPPHQPPASGLLVLGVDAGSTTTKAILLDPSTRGIVASHYARTRSDPVLATRDGLRAIAEQVGNVRIGLIATTGSARELAGAYLGTAHVYNEISAHAAGARHFDPDVDTIFEIGGQDAKYIYLRHGVPIDYAMNNACSAGTGSFLEESAQGDLGITVSNIAESALMAPAPVHFKATCAAFINSDIRIAQQQGQSRDNIIAGLVYAIADNYLTKVKGPRFVGKKVFLQGGVALNRAVGHAFAHSVGRPIVIPPNPELLGALGVALLAVERCGAVLEETADLLSLAEPEMKSPGRFTCGACQMRCSIDRFEVAGRQFPFGGRCSLFENVWKRKARSSPIEDLVERRAGLVFGRPDGAMRLNGLTVGIPRALTTHTLYPLYSAFFSTLGIDVVLSNVDPGGDLKSYSGFCFPTQVAHGAVLDLVRRNVTLIFLPHVVSMPQLQSSRESYLCPVTQASSYFLAKAFPDVHFLSPLLDFRQGYEASSALVEMAVQDLAVDRELAQRACAAAVRAQRKAESAMLALGQKALDEVTTQSKPAILLAGHSYNAYAPEASQSVGKKLASMGVTAIPADCLFPMGDGATAWHFSNQVLNAVAIAKRHPNLFLLCVSNFSCTVDAFTHSLIASEMGAKPYLILEIDAHTADAGVQTRLEAFLDIIHNYQESQVLRSEPFEPCQLSADGRLTRSNEERVPLSDPRVRLYFPNFSQYHSEALAMAVGWLGLQAGEVYPLERAQLDRGLQHTSGRECLPLPICIGQLLQVHERRRAGEIAGFYMLPGGAPCVVDAYMGYLERFIIKQRLNDLFLLAPSEANNHCGFKETTLASRTLPAVLVADILVEIDEVLRVVGAGDSLTQLARRWQQFRTTAMSLEDFHAKLPNFIESLGTLPRSRDPLSCPRVLVTGDFFTRFSPFFMEGVRNLYSERGIILKPVDLNDLILYGAYYGVAENARRWGLKPGGMALAKACTRIFRPDGKEYLQRWLAYYADVRAEQYYRGLFQKSGLSSAIARNVSALFSKASEHVSATIFGEVIPTVGDGVEAESEGYDGVIVIGPFNCLPFRISEAILKPLCQQHGMPMLTYESDGFAVSPSFLRQVDVHAQQVLEHRSRMLSRACA